MMHSTFGGLTAGPLPVSHAQDAAFDDFSRQLALAQQSRRTSRGSNGQRSGTAMRVVKPSSTSTSPRSTSIMGRRKTIVNDGNAQRRRQQVLEQASLFYGAPPQQQQQPQQQQAPTSRPSRPVSWHPGSYGQPFDSTFQQPTTAFTSANPYANQRDMYAWYPHVSPMMASHSCNTSPSSAFSPTPLPAADGLPYLAGEGAGLTAPSCTYPATSVPQLTPEAYTTTDEAASYSNEWNWNSFLMHGLNATSPPTPVAFPPTEMSQPAMTEASIPYQALDDPNEDDGEVLVGMGLYDAPEKYDEDPQLDNYRSTVSSLLGSPFRRQEPQGKGLKLEETWEPPKSDDEDEDEDEDDQNSDDEDEKSN